MMIKRPVLALTLTLLAGGAVAQTSTAPAACPMTYEFFEFAVPHLDLAQCPKDLARAGAFCRATVASDMVHVFVFAEAGDQCLLGAKSYKEGQYQFSVK
jgi:hypothetical protein